LARRSKLPDWITAAALSWWRGVQNREREFSCSDYHPGDHVFTFESGRPPHPDTIRQPPDVISE
jgi:hypothetical protein